MNTVAALQADLRETTLGTRSRLAEPVCGMVLLKRTVQQLLKVRRISQVVVLSPENQVSTCHDILDGLGVCVQGIAGQPSPWTRLIRTSRKWSLDGWRGGVGGSTVFDEFTDCRVHTKLLESVPADAILSVPAGAPLIDPVLADEMLEHREKHRDSARMTFTTAVPGLAGIVLDKDLIRELAASGTPISWLFSYKPDDPRKDLIFQTACMDIPAPLRFATGRLIADTDTAFMRVKQMLERRESWTLSDIGQYLLDEDEKSTMEFPHEIEIELTTDDPYLNSALVPRGMRLGRTQTMGLATLQAIGDELIQRDDSLVVLGGFGDPLRHPHFEKMLEILRPRKSSTRGVFGLCVRTSGLELNLPICEALIEHEVDVLQVSLDAWTEMTYHRVKGIPAEGDGQFSQVLSNLELLGKLQKDRKSPVPIVVPDMIKVRENVAELDDFFDGWLRRLGAVSITGFSDFAGQLENHGVIAMHPPARIPCRRLRSRCLILADGSVTLCDQDFRGQHCMGHIGNQKLSEVWRSPALARIRRQHQEAQFDCLPLCASCTQWHRP